MIFNRRHALGIFLFAGLLIADQISKWVMTEMVLRPVSRFPSDNAQPFFDWLIAPPDRLEFIRIYVTPFFNWVMVWNEGVSFGLFSDGGEYNVLIFGGLAVIISLIFTIWFFRSHRWTLLIGLAMVVSGAIGNLIDRVRFGAVIDFLDFHVAGYHWPAFNIADAAIVIGVGILIFDAIFLDRPQENLVESNS